MKWRLSYNEDMTKNLIIKLGNHVVDLPIVPFNQTCSGSCIMLGSTAKSDSGSSIVEMSMDSSHFISRANISLLSSYQTSQPSVSNCWCKEWWGRNSRYQTCLHIPHTTYSHQPLQRVWSEELVQSLQPDLAKSREWREPAEGILWWVTI